MAKIQVPRNIQVRPLTQGINTDETSNVLPIGSFLKVDNYLITRSGPKLRPGLERFSNLIDLSNGRYESLRFNDVTGRVFDLINFWTSDGEVELLAFTSDGFYTVANVKTSSTFSNQNMRYDITVDGISTSDGGLTLTLTGTDFDSGEYVTGKSFSGKIGDWVIYNDTSNVDISNGDVMGQITSITATEITIQRANAEGYSTSTPFEAQIVHQFESENLTFGDFTLVSDASNSYLVMTNYNEQYYYKGNGQLEFLELDGTASSGVPSAPAVTIDKFKACTFFQDRFFIANTVEEFSTDPGVEETARQRIRWGLIDSVLDSEAKFRFYPENYIDLPYSKGEILRLEGLGKMLVVYFNDSIYLGRPSNIPSLPVIFEKLDTGGVGLVGQKALAIWQDAHYWVGTDGIYRLGVDGGLTEIGSKIVSEALDNNRFLSNVIATPDPENERIVFGFPAENQSSLDYTNSLFEKVYSYYYKLDSWGKELASFDESTEVYNYKYNSLSNLNNTTIIGSGTTWNDLLTAGTTWQDWIDQGITWNVLFVTSSRSTVLLYGLALENAPDRTWGVKNFYFLGDDAVQDTITNSMTYDVNGLFETQDFDFDLPDEVKIFTRISMKLQTAIQEDINIPVYGSVDFGNTWKFLGNMTFLNGKTESKLNFRQKGSVFRFRAEFEGQTELFPTHIEYVLRATIREREDAL